MINYITHHGFTYPLIIKGRSRYMGWLDPERKGNRHKKKLFTNFNYLLYQWRDQQNWFEWWKERKRLNSEKRENGIVQ